MKVTLLTLMLASLSTLSASVIFYAEAPGLQSTHLGGVVVETFDAVSPGGLGNYSSTIGHYSTGAQVVGPDIFGGANLSNYAAVGVQSGTSSYTLTFNGAQNFFGFYWLAMDVNNLVQFYNGVNLVASISASDVLGILSPAYYGNPNTSTNTTEPYAFIGFMSDNQATDFTSIVFVQTNPGMGFETDNHTVLASSNGGSVQPTPEPATVAMLVPAIGALAFAARRRRQKQAL
jgi:hypothetical protein